jgi:hypothetical protein
MTFLNPLHKLSLDKGQFAAMDALSDWALLSVDPSAKTLPIWRLQSLSSASLRATPGHTFVRQDKHRQFLCYKNTAKWCGFLSGLAYFCQELFQEEALYLAEEALAREIPIRQRYPYQIARAWHSEENLPIIGWITERMVNLDEHDAEIFIQNLFAHWVNAYSLDELPTNRPHETDLHYRRSYFFYTMSLNFETVRFDSPDECEEYFGRYERQKVLKRRS